MAAFDDSYGGSSLMRVRVNARVSNCISQFECLCVSVSGFVSLKWRNIGYLCDCF